MSQETKTSAVYTLTRDVSPHILIERDKRGSRRRGVLKLGEGVAVVTLRTRGGRVVSLKRFDLLYSTTYTVRAGGASSRLTQNDALSAFKKIPSPPLNRNYHLMLSPYDFIELNLIELLKRCPDVCRLVNRKILNFYLDFGGHIMPWFDICFVRYITFFIQLCSYFDTAVSAFLNLFNVILYKHWHNRGFYYKHQSNNLENTVFLNLVCMELSNLDKKYRACICLLSAASY